MSAKNDKRPETGSSGAGLSSFAGPNLRAFALRLAIAGAGLVILFHLAGAPYIRGILPLHAAILARIQPHYDIQRIQVEGSNIRLETLVRRTVLDEQGQPLRVKRVVPVAISASTLYTQPIILLALLAVWVRFSWRRRAWAFLLAIPILAAIAILDVPFTLAWEVEDAVAADVPGAIKTIAFAGLKIQTRVQESQSLTYWYVFLQTGGRQFLAILGFLACIAPFSSWRKPPGE